jgi:hypothetical protein
MMIVILYLAAIVAANLLVVWFGPAVTPINAFLFIGLDLSCRDRLHDQWQHSGLWWKMALLIATGSLLSYLLNRNAGAIALASFVAFAAASSADAIAYAFLHKQGWYVRANGSNVVGAAVDSIVFPTLAFGVLLPWIVLAQFVAKVAGGLFWSWILHDVFHPALPSVSRPSAMGPVNDDAR